MKKLFYSILFSSILIYCKSKHPAPSAALIQAMELKRGAIISCSPASEQFGSADFEISCNDVQADFNLAVNLLHSFEYDEAEKKFADIIDKEPGCAMAYWGVAMSNFHALWSPPTEAELMKGSKAVEIAQSLKSTEREAAYINAIASFYNNRDKVDHKSRCIAFEQQMEQLYTQYPTDKEAVIFYCLALNAAANPQDTSFSKQIRAGNILQSLYPGQPGHPGIAHYLIHTYDYPGLAEKGLAAARAYASIAPSSAHALHMPSHIFTRLGLWDECIASNLVSVSSAKCYAEQAGIEGHWDEELHGIDYLVYAYLQKGMNDAALQLVKYMQTINKVYPVNFKVAYAFAATPSRYVLENRLWQKAANLDLTPVDFPWQKFPWQEAIYHFTRLMGAIHVNDLSASRLELGKLNNLHEQLLALKDEYKANQVAIQIKTGEAWINNQQGNTNKAIALMKEAAQMEDNTEKHPVTPGEVLPAKELLGDMLMECNQYEAALKAYEAVLQKDPNRFNTLFGAGNAAEKIGDHQKAKAYYQQLLLLAGDQQAIRPETNHCRQYLSTKIM